MGVLPSPQDPWSCVVSSRDLGFGSCFVKCSHMFWFMAFYHFFSFIFGSGVHCALSVYFSCSNMQFACLASDYKLCLFVSCCCRNLCFVCMYSSLCQVACFCKLNLEAFVCHCAVLKPVFHSSLWIWTADLCLINSAVCQGFRLRLDSG